MLLVLDNGSIYTQNLLDFLDEKKILYKKENPDKFEEPSLEKYDSVILSGRRKNEKRTNLVNSKIITHCILNNKKLLGICYGAEILSLTLGGTIKKLKNSEKGEVEISILQKNSLTNKKILVFESHSFEISKLPKELISLAKSNNCKYEIIQYQGKPIFGTQFHPEMSFDGKELILNFCSL